MSQYLDKDGASRIAENFLSKQAEQDAILRNLQFDLKEAEHALVKTIQGPAPLNIRALTRPLDDYAISGNTVQNGTPTPEAPVDVVGCGVRTENLFDYSTITTGYRIQWTDGNLYADNTAIMSDYIPVTEGNYTPSMSVLIVGYASDKSYVGTYSSNKTWEKRSSYAVSTFTVSSSSNVKFIKMLTYAAYEPITNTLMLNSGSTALPYEPYGYKLPISCGGTTTNVYLGEQSTTRRIKKLMFDGTEDWTIITNNNPYFRLIGETRDGSYSKVVCSHYVSPSSSISANNTAVGVRVQSTTDYGYVIVLRTPTWQTDTLSDFKSYLAAQYAAGTPVTLWYVLATEETGIVNEPLHKIGDYADTVTMAQAGVEISTTKGFNTITTDTTVLPSNIEVKGVINNA